MRGAKEAQEPSSSSRLCVALVARAAQRPSWSWHLGASQKSATAPQPQDICCLMTGGRRHWPSTSTVAFSGIGPLPFVSRGRGLFASGLLWVWQAQTGPQPSWHSRRELQPSGCHFFRAGPCLALIMRVPRRTGPASRQACPAGCFQGSCPRRDGAV